MHICYAMLYTLHNMYNVIYKYNMYMHMCMYSLHIYYTHTSCTHTNTTYKYPFSLEISNTDIITPFYR